MNLFTEGKTMNDTPFLPKAAENDAEKYKDAFVKNEEITMFAKPGCAYCTGTGKMTVVVPADGTAVVRKGNVTRVESLCGCAVRKFFRTYRTDIIFLRDSMLWSHKVDAINRALASAAETGEKAEKQPVSEEKPKRKTRKKAVKKSEPESGDELDNA